MGYPVPKRDNEVRATKKPGPVISYMLSPEELALLRNQSVKVPKTDEGRNVKKPIDLSRNPRYTPEEQSRRAKARYAKKENAYKPDMTKFLEFIAAGSTIADVERRWGMSKNSLYYWVKKWQLIGVTAGNAEKLLRGKI